MKIKKIKINGYDVFIYKTKKYSSINMKFLFEMPYTRENIFKYDLLEEYQIHSSKKYKTRKELNDRSMELYSTSWGINNYHVGEKMFTEANFNFYDPLLVKDDYLKEAFEFAKDIMMYPNFDGVKLDSSELERSKANLISAVGDELMDFRSRAGKNFIETLYPNTYKTIDSIKTKAEYEGTLNSFSDEDLIKAHEQLFEHSLVGLIIMGNIKDEYLNYIEELFKFEEVKKLDEDYKEIIPMDPDLKEFNHVVDPDYGESIVRAVYSFPAENLKDKLVYSVICRMIGSNGMLIHKTLRDEQGIVYSAGAGFNRKLNYIMMIAYIDAKNVDVALEGFEIVLKKLEDATLRKKLLQKVKEKDDLAMYTFDESKWNPFYELYDLSFNFDVSSKEKWKIIKSITDKDIVDALKKMKRVTVHFYEGAKK